MYLSFLFKATFLFNCIIYLSVLQVVFTDVSAKINTHVCYRFAIESHLFILEFQNYIYRCWSYN